MKKPDGSQQVVDDYVEALLGDVLGATEPHREPGTACVGTDAAAGPGVSLAAAPVVEDIAAVSSIHEGAQTDEPALMEAMPGEAMSVDTTPVRTTPFQTTPFDTVSFEATSRGATPLGTASLAATTPLQTVPFDATPVEAPRAGTPAETARQPTGMPHTPGSDAPAFAAARSPTAPVVVSPLSLPAAQRWLRVTVSGGSYALELLSVQEVVRVAPIVAMRGAGRAVLGVMNLRGRIVPVFDLGLWLGTPCVQPDERSRIVVVERHDELIGVLVSGVDDVVTLGRERIEPPLPGTRPGAILGIARVVAAPTVLLDAGALFAG